MMTSSARFLVEIEYEPLAVEVTTSTDDVITCRPLSRLQVARLAIGPSASKDREQGRARITDIIEGLRANPPRGFDIIAPLGGAPSERWVETLRRYGLPDDPGSVVPRLADLWTSDWRQWEFQSPEAGDQIVYKIPLGWLQGYAWAAQLLTAISQGEEQAFNLVKEKLPRGWPVAFNWKYRGDIVEEVVWDTVAQTARLGAPRPRFSGEIDNETDARWSLTVEGWWHALVAMKFVRGTRYVPPRRFRCDGCGELVDPGRLRGRALADGARKFCSNRCRWRTLQQDHRRRRRERQGLSDD